MELIFISLEQSLLFFPIVLGIYLSYHILKITDLSIDGTYVLGAAIFVKTIYMGPVVAIFFSIIVGVTVGCIISYMQRENIVNDLVVGILASFMLYSVNLQVMGRPNISILGKLTILDLVGAKEWIILLLIIDIILALLMSLLLKSHLGLVFRAFGHNQKLLSVLGKSVELYRMIGLIISGGLAALTGTLSAQINGFADLNMGFGVTLISIGAVIIGRHVFVRENTDFNSLKEILSCFMGIFFYFLCLSFLLKIGIEPANLKLMLGILLFLALHKVHKVKT